MTEQGMGLVMGRLKPVQFSLFCGLWSSSMVQHLNKVDGSLGGPQSTMAWRCWTGEVKFCSRGLEGGLYKVISLALVKL